MSLKFIRTEFKKLLVNRRFWLNFVILAISAFAIIAFLDGLLSKLVNSDDIEGLTDTLSSFNLHTSFLQLFSITSFLVILTECVPYILKDFEYKVDELVFTSPIGLKNYFQAKSILVFIQTFAFNLAVLLGIIIYQLYFIKNEPPFLNGFSTILETILLGLLPLSFIISNIIVNLSLQFRSRIVYVFATSLVYILPQVISGIFSRLSWYPILTWLDPTGGLFLSDLVSNKTISEVNKYSLVDIKYLLFLLFWILIIIVWSQLSLNKFKWEIIAKSKTHTQTKFDDYTKLPDYSTPKIESIRQFLPVFKINFLSNIKTYPTLVLTGLYISLFLFYALSNFSFNSIKLIPTTQVINFWITASTFIYSLCYSSYLAFSTLNKPFENKVDQLESSKPVSSFIVYTANIVSIWCVQLCMILPVFLIGMLSMWILKSQVPQPHILLFDILALQIVVLMILIHSFFLAILFKKNVLVFIPPIISLIINTIYEYIPIPTIFYDFNTKIGLIYNDFTIGYSLDFLLYRYLYWFGIFIFILIGLYFLTRRLDHVQTNFISTIFKTKSIIIFIITGLLFFSVGFSGLIYGHFINDKYYFEPEAVLAHYEKKYVKYINEPNLNVNSYDLKWEVKPSKGSFKLDGKYELQNLENRPINTIFVDSLYYELDSLKLDFPAEIVQDTELNAYIFNLTEPIQPQQKINLEFSIKYDRKIFNADYDELNGNFLDPDGTMFDFDILPSLGYNETKQTSSKRSKFGLPDKVPRRNLSLEDRKARSLISNNRTKVKFRSEFVVYDNQIAVAPGKLISSQKESDKTISIYEDESILPYFNFFFGKYEVDKFNYKDISFEIYRHPKHSVNVEEMKKALRDTLDYMTENYTLYPRDYFRITEFGSGQIAQSIQGSVAFGDQFFQTENDPNASSKLSEVYHVTSHEFIHQWFGHIYSASKLDGDSFLTESITEYSSFQVIKNRFGEDKLSTYKLDAAKNYNKFRTKLSKESDEKPLGTINYLDQMSEIHYQKGALVLDTINRILGSNKLNQLIKEQLLYYKKNQEFADPQLLINSIIDNTPDSYKKYVKELLLEVSIYDFKLSNVKVEDIGEKNEIKFNASANKKKIIDKKYVDDNLENLKVNIGLYDKELKLLAMREIEVSGESKEFKLEISKSNLPLDKIVIDPNMNYIDSNLRNNSKNLAGETLSDLANEFDNIISELD